MEPFIAEDEVECKSCHLMTAHSHNEGVAEFAKYLNRNGYTKKPKTDNTIRDFFRDFCEKFIVQSRLLGKICLQADERTEKKQGTRNEMHVVEQSSSRFKKDNSEATFPKQDWYLTVKAQDQFL